MNPASCHSRNLQAGIHAGYQAARPHGREVRRKTAGMTDWNARFMGSSRLLLAAYRGVLLGENRPSPEGKGTYWIRHLNLS
jgi:hypothetical protein